MLDDLFEGQGRDERDVRGSRRNAQPQPKGLRGLLQRVMNAFGEGDDDDRGPDSSGRRGRREERDRFDFDD